MTKRGPLSFVPDGPLKREGTANLQGGPFRTNLVEYTTDPRDILGRYALNRRRQLLFGFPGTARKVHDQFRQIGILPILASYAVVPTLTTHRTFGIYGSKRFGAAARRELAKNTTRNTQFVFDDEVRHVMRQPIVEAGRRLHE
jgi:hypothetical protein